MTDARERAKPGTHVQDAAERRQVDQFYRGVDTNLKLVGASRMGAQNVWVRLSRYAVHSNLLEPELRAALAQVTDLHSWYPAWASRAAHFEALGDAALSVGHRVSAAEYLLTATALYHVAQINTRPENPLKIEGASHAVDCYRRAAPHFDPPAERFELPVDGGCLPGYLRRPHGGGRPPVVVLVNGANSSKEELHVWTDAFLRRGLATVAFDGPGQAENAPRHGGIVLTPERYDRAVGTVLDWIDNRPELDRSRVGLWGMSLGGFLVARAAAADRRVRATVSVGGLYSLEQFWNLPLPVQEEVRELSGLETLAETASTATAAYQPPAPGSIHCPFLVVHGALDDIVATDDARRLAALAGGQGETWVFEDGVHVCYNLFQELRPRIADWLADALRAGPADAAGEAS